MPASPNVGIGLARRGVQRDEPVARRDVQHAVVTAPVGPQYATPRPESCRGASPPRRPSRRLCIQISSPVRASRAMAARRVPAVVYSTPPTMSGVPSSLYSGAAPRLSVLKVQATSRSLKLEASIWSSGEIAGAPLVGGVLGPFAAGRARKRLGLTGYTE